MRLPRALGIYDTNHTPSLEHSQGTIGTAIFDQAPCATAIFAFTIMIQACTLPAGLSRFVRAPSLREAKPISPKENPFCAPAAARSHSRNWSHRRSNRRHRVCTATASILHMPCTHPKDMRAHIHMHCNTNTDSIMVLSKCVWLGFIPLQILPTTMVYSKFNV